MTLTDFTSFCQPKSISEFPHSCVDVHFAGQKQQRQQAAAQTSKRMLQVMATTDSEQPFDRRKAPLVVANVSGTVEDVHEAVLAHLHNRGLPKPQRLWLLFYDSAGNTSQMLWSHARDEYVAPLSDLHFMAIYGMLCLPSRCSVLVLVRLSRCCGMLVVHCWM